MRSGEDDDACHDDCGEVQIDGEGVLEVAAGRSPERVVCIDARCKAHLQPSRAVGVLELRDATQPRHEC